VSSPIVLTNFEAVWRAAETETLVRHPVRFDYLVYYYDPLWKASWGECEGACSYLSLGSQVLPIKAGQRVRVEGTMVPGNDMTVDDPVVTLLDAAPPLHPVPTAGHVGDAARFTKRFVTLTGLVDRQTTRDANHVELQIISEGHVVLGELLVRNEAPMPAYAGSFIRTEGVYFARQDPGGSRLELWIPDRHHTQITGTLDADPRWNLPVTPCANLAKHRVGEIMHIQGRVREQQIGRSVNIRDEGDEIHVESRQTRSLAFGQGVQAVGRLAKRGARIFLTDALVRTDRPTLNVIEEIYSVPEDEAHDSHHVHWDVVMYYYDPLWRVAWGRSGGVDCFFSLAGGAFDLGFGDHVLIDGSVVPAKGPHVTDATVTLLNHGAKVDLLEPRADLGNFDRFDRHPVRIEGYVDRQIANDATHTELDLIAGGRLISVRLLTTQPAPSLEGTLLRVDGVYSATTDPAGGTRKIEIWSEGARHIDVLGRLDHDPRFNTPVTPIEAVVPSTAPVHVIGAVRAQQPGIGLTLRDEGGQIVARSLQSMRVTLGQSVEVIGIPVRDGTSLVLQDALYRVAPAKAPTPPAAPPRIRLAEQLRDLSVEEAQRHYPVHLTGTVTWSNAAAPEFYMQDVSGGACVRRDAAIPLPLVGWKVDVLGVSELGSFAPMVVANAVEASGALDLPDARPVTLEQALTGIEEGHWVAMSGYVREVEPMGGLARLQLTTSGGDFEALLPATDDLANLRSAVVRLRGVCCALSNRKRQLTGIQLRVPSTEYVELEEPVPKNVFAVPIRTVASLRQFGSLQVLNRRVRVAGIVLSQSLGRHVRLQDGTDGLLVLSRDTAPLAAGDHIEAVGFPGRESSRLVLREATIRKTGSGAQPRPEDIVALAPVDVDLDGRLVRLSADLLEVSEHEAGVRLVCRAKSGIFEALLDRPKASVPRDWASGARLALTGIHVVEFDEYHRPAHVRLELRSVADVQVLQRASWWTMEKILVVTAALALVALAGLAGVIALRGRVKRQTVQMRTQSEKEKAARLEAVMARASKLEALGVMAGGIAHDFNNLLTVILCNLSLARLDPQLTRETECCLGESERATGRARDLTQQLLTFAKGGAPVRAATRLADIVRESAEFVLHGSKSRCDFDIAPELWAAHVDRGQIAQVVQNLVINATQAMPQGGSIHMVLRNAEVRAGTVPSLEAGRYLELSIEDTGAGIPAAIMPRIFDPYFTTKQQGSGLGLATVYSIVKQHLGHLEVESREGMGTTFTVWLPASNETPAAEPAVTREFPHRTGRVLLMDDEPSIRQLGEVVLRRMGLAVTAVSHGQAVVEAYTAAKAAGHPYDLLILDLTVPGAMGGLEAMQQLQQLGGEIRAIVSSGYSSDPVMAEYRAHGFASVVVKPYEAGELARTVDAVLGATVG